MSVYVSRRAAMENAMEDAVLAWQPTLSIIVPTRNEQGNIAALARRVSLALATVSYEIIFVDDSDDATPDAIRQARANDPRVRLLHRVPGEARVGGLATAVVAGLQAAQGALLAVIDADLQHPPETLASLVAAAQDADIVVASRYIPGGSPGGLAGPVRLLVSRSTAALAGLSFRRVRACSDPMSGFFLVRREVIAGVDLRPQGFKILLEILVRGKWSMLAEVPYVFATREAEQSKASLRQGVEYLRHLRVLRFQGRRGHGSVIYRRLSPADAETADQELARIEA